MVSEKIKNYLINLVTTILIIGLGYLIFPQEFIRSNELADNPQGCPYYITIKSLLANYLLLSFDKSNANFIKQRFIKFENNIKISQPYASKYQKSYYEKLNAHGFTSIRLVPYTSLLELAQKLAPIVDRYYLDANTACHNPLYVWDLNRTRRILQYNLSPLYDHIPQRNMRILAASKSAYQLGIFSGFFVNNQTTTLGTEFMTGMPLLTALYVQPKYDFNKIGGYSSPVPWTFFNSNYFINPNLRKILDISGIDVFTVDTRELNKRTILGTRPVTHHLYQQFSDAKYLKTFINTQSYGVAYLANQIFYADLEKVQGHEELIKNYFAKPSYHIPAVFKQSTNFFYQQLFKLKKSHDIILESHDTHLPASKLNAGEVKTRGIVAERAFFNANCARANCIFVANIAYSPGWHLFVNGTERKIERANFAFIATEIPNGESNIWLIYETWPRLLGYFISISFLIVIFSIAIREKFKNS